MSLSRQKAVQDLHESLGFGSESHIPYSVAQLTADERELFNSREIESLDIQYDLLKATGATGFFFSMTHSF